MKIWITQANHKVTRLISGRNNIYLINSGNLNILVDTGLKSVYRLLKKNLSKVDVLPGMIKYLVLTHTHFDHCRNAHAIKKEYGPSIIVGKDEEGYTKQGYTPLPAGTYPFTDQLSKIGSRIGKKGFGYEPFEPDMVVDDEFEINESGLNIRLLKTGGHSAGSLCLLIDNEIALTGDEFVGFFPGSVFPPFADNTIKMIKSWKKLLDTGCQIFLPAHGKEINRELLLSEYNKYASKFGA